MCGRLPPSSSHRPLLMRRSHAPDYPIITLRTCTRARRAAGTVRSTRGIPYPRPSRSTTTPPTKVPSTTLRTRSRPRTAPVGIRPHQRARPRGWPFRAVPRRSGGEPPRVPHGLGPVGRDVSPTVDLALRREPHIPVSVNGAVAGTLTALNLGGAFVDIQRRRRLRVRLTAGWTRSCSTTPRDGRPTWTVIHIGAYRLPMVVLFFWVAAHH